MHGILLKPFEPAHLDGVDWGAQAWMIPYFDFDQAMKPSNYARSVFCDGVFIGAGGVVEIHEFRGLAWGVPLAGHRKAFRTMHRLVERGLSLQPYPRIEAYIDPEFTEAARWAKTLGFRQECRNIPYFFPDGRSGSVWALLRD